MKKSNFLNLTKILLFRLVKNKGVIVIFATTIVLNVLLNILSLILVTKTSLKFYYLKIYFNAFPLVVTLFLSILIALIVIKMYTEHYEEKIIALEKRLGYSNNEVYFSRILVFVLIFSSFILIISIFNTIFYSFSIKGVLFKSLFLNSLGWYTIWGVLMFTIILIGSIFIKPIINLILIFLFTITVEIGIILYPFIFDIGGARFSYLGKQSFMLTYAYQKRNDIISTNKVSKSIYQESTKILKSFKEQAENNEGNINDIREFQKSQFLLGPNFWNNKLSESGDFPEYSKMVNYFRNIFKNSPDKFLGFKKQYSLDNISDYKMMNNFKKFVQKENKQYPFINDLLEHYFDNYIFLNAFKIGEWSLEFLVNSDKLSLIKEKYQNWFEYTYFLIINKIFFTKIYNEELITEGPIREKFPDRILKKSANSNLLSGFGQLSLMYLGRSYGKDFLYMSVSNDMNLLGYNINLKSYMKTLENGDKYYTFTEYISVVGLYLAYTTISITTSGLMYFAFRRKIKK